MISYSLRCRPGSHGFDAWFRSSADWEKQAGLGLVSCPICGATEVEKALMAPAVVTARRGEAAPAAFVAERSAETGGAMVPAANGLAPAAVAMAMGAPPELAEAFAKLQDLAREVRAKADYVGTRFAEEARRIHFGEAPARGIYGEASRDEVEALGEEGIVALPLPPLPEDRN
ncbi:DUF1178 family protein [Antarcticirhabdus aurantiaca]|uniref:DUF1178 family protein n=1 Tax=Antarcticirhabdus aurantiaca TaxID=2606717 RepID=A0ACD4NRZ9_9HYPH|nr:DUF1178 family protein [Antarcticirhabdus aurantiaca]WAJ29670.1 DUF1178 family protein [Jeongeuplla avenae]